MCCDSQFYQQHVYVFRSLILVRKQKRCKTTTTTTTISNDKPVNN